MEIRGARYLHVLVPCPLGWGTRPGDTIRIARLAKETGIFPVFEAEDGEVVGVSPIRRRVPVEEYLRPQGRFAHLFGDPRRAPTSSRGSRHRADRNIAPLRPARETRGSRDGQAVRDHARRRLQPGQQDRLVAHRAARLRRPAAAVQQRLPGRREHPAVALPRRGGGELRGAPGASSCADNPFPADDGPGLLPPVRDRLQPRRSSTRRSASTRSNGSSATRRSEQGWTRRGDRAAERASACWSSAPGPSGLSAAYHLRAARPRGHGPRRRADGRRHDALRHPGATGCPATCSTRRSQRIVDLGVELELERRSTDARAAMREGGFDAVFLAVGAHIGKPRVHAGRRRRRTILDAVSLLREHGGRGAAAARPARRRLRRRQHRDGRGPDREAARRRPTRSSSTGGPATGCRRTTSRSRRRRRRAC